MSLRGQFLEWLGKLIFKIRRHRKINSIDQMEEAFTHLDSVCHEKNLKYYMNLGRTNYIDLQITHPSSFTDNEAYGYTIYLTGSLNDEDSRELKNLKSNSEILGSLRDISEEGLIAYVYESSERNSIIKQTEKILLEIFDYSQNDKVYYDVNLFKE